MFTRIATHGDKVDTLQGRMSSDSVYAIYNYTVLKWLYWRWKRIYVFAATIIHWQLEQSIPREIWLNC